MFRRSDYYSQTEATKILKLSIKRFKALVEQHKLKVIEVPVDLGLYSTTALYYLKEDIEILVEKNST